MVSPRPSRSPCRINTWSGFTGFVKGECSPGSRCQPLCGEVEVDPHRSVDQSPRHGARGRASSLRSPVTCDRRVGLHKLELVQHRQAHHQYLAGSLDQRHTSTVQDFGSLVHRQHASLAGSCSRSTIHHTNKQFLQFTLLQLSSEQYSLFRVTSLLPGAVQIKSAIHFE